jgi:hypothetical protein
MVNQLISIHPISFVDGSFRSLVYFGGASLGLDAAAAFDVFCGAD